MLVGDACKPTCSTAKGAIFAMVIVVNHGLPRASASANPTFKCEVDLGKRLKR